MSGHSQSSRAEFQANKRPCLRGKLEGTCEEAYPRLSLTLTCVLCMGIPHHHTQVCMLGIQEREGETERGREGGREGQREGGRRNYLLPNVKTSAEPSCCPQTRCFGNTAPRKGLVHSHPGQQWTDLELHRVPFYQAPFLFLDDPVNVLRHWTQKLNYTTNIVHVNSI